MSINFRLWVISSFVVVLLICSIGVWVFINSINKTNDLENFHSNLKSTRILLLEVNKLKEDILVVDNSETKFYTNNVSITEERFKELNLKITSFLHYFEKSKILEKYSLQKKIENLKTQIIEHNQNYNQLIYLYKLKGFKSFGLEGKMRNYAHNIYDFNNKEVQFYCLMLRRHEKDFLLRKDLSYVHQFNTVCQKFIDMINKNPSITNKDKSYLIDQLYFYNKYFLSLARIESRIGVKGRTGNLEKSKTIFNLIASDIESLDAEVKQLIVKQKENLKKETLTLLLILILFLLSAIIILSSIITNSVKSISLSFSFYINSGFNFEAISYKKSLIKEFNSINLGFFKMAKEINIFTNFFKEKVHERTLAIQQQKEEILNQQLAIETHNKTLLSNNRELSKQKQLLSRKNNEKLESLRYAKRIQKAIQPTTVEFKSYFEDCFVYYKPKDVVSGDFYLIYDNQFSNNSKINFVTADCTGHGVPGAIMSVLGINTIQKIIQEQKVLEPGLILNKLDKDINQVLVHGKIKEEIVADGMDIAVFTFDKNNYLLEYSIAKFPNYIVRNSEIITLETHKYSIGFSFFESEQKKFGTNQFQLLPGDCLYLFSDGFPDQFGGPNNKKYKYSNIKSLLLKIYKLDMKSQKNIIQDEFKSWKGNYSQIDDVMMIGIQF
jgi:serine phosphatase RsbU (regulator of sigma subunit)